MNQLVPKTGTVGWRLPLVGMDAGYITGPGGTPIEQVDGAGNVKYYLVTVHLG